jgi:type I restriction enzyme S subunit
MKSEWKVKPISELVKFNPPYTLARGVTVSYVEMAALPVFNREISYFQEREFKGGGSRFKNGDVLFARITPCLQNGKTCRVSGLQDEQIANGSTEFIVLSAKDKKYDNGFVYYTSIDKVFREFAKGRMEGTTGRQRVSWQALSEYEMLIPPLIARRKIAHILSTLDDKIELNRKMNETLESMAQAIFKSWFVDFDPVHAKAGASSEDELDKAAKDLGISREVLDLFPSEFEESELGLIPRGWEVKALDRVAHYQNGLALQKFRPKDENNFLPVLKIAQLKKGFAGGEEKADPSIKAECIVNSGDVVFSWSGSLFVDIWCGGKVALNQHLFKVTSDKYSKWFYYYWTKQHLINFQQIAADKAVTIGHIKRSHLAEALCVIPDEEVLNRLDEIISPLLEKLIVNRLETFSLQKTRDTLLPKLLSGELDVSNLNLGLTDD